SDHRSVPFIGPNGSYLSDKGLTGVASQTARIQSHGGLIYHIKQLRKTHPEVDIVLIEPSTSDYQMTFTNIMRYSTRLTLARHGFETVTLKLAENYEYLDNLLSRYGIAITERLVDEELEAIRAADYKPSVLRRILERRPVQSKQSSTSGITESLTILSDTLDELDAILSDWPDYQSQRPARRLADNTIGARTPARSIE
ncbi:MAG: ATP phosphoribosyltransferase regulatory subunit, partial [Chloroflexi bacterium]|nr:ATP phosphoribosyltransferase regulatory subunit [Chloroflexota bacterium]